MDNLILFLAFLDYDTDYDSEPVTLTGIIALVIFIGCWYGVGEGGRRLYRHLFSKNRTLPPVKKAGFIAIFAAYVLLGIWFLVFFVLLNVGKVVKQSL